MTEGRMVVDRMVVGGKEKNVTYFVRQTDASRPAYAGKPSSETPQAQQQPPIAKVICLPAYRVMEVDEAKGDFEIVPPEGMMQCELESNLAETGDAEIGRIVDSNIDAMMTSTPVDPDEIDRGETMYMGAEPAKMQEGVMLSFNSRPREEIDAAVLSYCKSFHGIDDLKVNENQGGMSRTYLGKKDGKTTCFVKAATVITAKNLDQGRKQREISEMTNAVPYVHDIHLEMLADGTPLPLMVCEYFQSREMDTYIHRHSLDQLDQLIIFRKFIEELTAIHEQANMVHLDVKPHNALVSDDQELEVIPSLYAMLGKKVPDYKPVAPTAVKNARVKLTDTELAEKIGSTVPKGGFIGTPQYMAPECFVPGTSVERTMDIWSAGAMLYEMVTGQVPDKEALKDISPSKVAGEEFVRGIMASKFKGLPAETIDELVQKSGFKKGISEVIFNCINPDPAKRYQDGYALGTAMDAVIEELDSDATKNFLSQLRDGVTMGKMYGVTGSIDGFETKTSETGALKEYGDVLSNMTPWPNQETGNEYPTGYNHSQTDSGEWVQHMVALNPECLNVKIPKPERRYDQKSRKRTVIGSAEETQQM